MSGGGILDGLHKLSGPEITDDMLKENDVLSKLRESE